MKINFCSIFGHSYLYNVEGYLRICKHCRQKEVYSFMENGEWRWIPVEEFIFEKRTDEELLREWKPKKMK